MVIGDNPQISSDHLHILHFGRAILVTKLVDLLLVNGSERQWQWHWEFTDFEQLGVMEQLRKRSSE